MNTTAIITQLIEWMGVVSVTWLLTLSPRFKQAKVGFLYARRDGMVALSLSALMLVFSFVFYSTPIGASVMGLLPASIGTNDLQGQLFLTLICLLMVIAALIVRAQPPLSAGWNPKTMVLGLQAGAALAITTIFLRNRAMDMLVGLTPDRWRYLLFALALALAEETIFRGFVQLRLCWWLGEIRGWVAAALIYTVWKLPALLSVNGGKADAILAGFALLLVQALITGWIMRKFGNVLAPGLYRAASIWMNIFI